jgi:preprotein translocase subunit SecF
MEIFRPNLDIDFIGKQRIFVTASAILVAVCLLSFAAPGLRYGVDFAGGTVIQFRFENPVRADQIRESVGKAVGGTPSVQSFGGANEYIVQMEQSSEDLEGISQKVREALVADLGDSTVEVRRVEMVGPKVGKDLRQKGLIAAALALTGILLYVWWRFEFYYSLGGVAALFHDCILTLGAYSIFAREFDLTGLAAVLTIAGFSINDTIVVFDRVREHVRKSGGKGDLAKIMNRAVNETLSRTVLTSGTLLFVVLALLLFGGPVIHNFAFGMLIGVVAGSYSTIYVAGPIALFFHQRLQRRPAKVAA